MLLPKAVRENLYFLLAETSSQVANLDVLMETASVAVAQRILDRSGYTYNLKMRVHDGCLDAFRGPKNSAADIYSLRAAEAVASGLERLTDICQDGARLILGVKRKQILTRHNGVLLLRDVAKGLSLIEQALESTDTKLVLKVGNIERKLDQSYTRIFSKQVSELTKRKHAEDTVIALLLIHRIEEMGDVLLEISEALVSARLGQPMHVDRFRSLQDAVADLGLADAAVEAIAETKSGSGISGISDANADEDGYVAIFKDGKTNKLDEERDRVRDWHDIFPGLAPQIFSYKKKGKNASLLIEHLPGLTFEKIILQEPDDILAAAEKRLFKTLKAVWQETKRKKIIPANHIDQLTKRLDMVTQIHPTLVETGGRVCGVPLKTLDELMTTAKTIEGRLDPPFSVFIHGDFNLDNIIFDPETRDIRFIDLHRSRYLDYVQDVAVFMVSNYRLQVMESKVRRRMTHMAVRMHEFAGDFAKKHNDSTFNARLAFGLARSFITSTRFILDQTVAANMMMRGLYLLERVQGLNKKQAKSFQLPIQDLFS